MSTGPILIEPASADDFAGIIAADRAASELFRPTGLLNEEALADTVSLGALESAARGGMLDVAKTVSDDIVGFALVSVREAGLYLDQISVVPRFGRQGIGRRLLNQVEQKAKALGAPHISLSTFRDLPWNAPFYASAGYSVLARELFAPYMLEIEQAQRPFMDVSKRVFMRKHVRDGTFRATTPE